MVKENKSQKKDPARKRLEQLPLRVSDYEFAILTRGAELSTSPSRNAWIISLAVEEAKKLIQEKGDEDDVYAYIKCAPGKLPFHGEDGWSKHIEKSWMRNNDVPDGQTARIIPRTKPNRNGTKPAQDTATKANFTVSPYANQMTYGIPGFTSPEKLEQLVAERVKKELEAAKKKK